MASTRWLKGLVVVGVLVAFFAMLPGMMQADPADAAPAAAPADDDEGAAGGAVEGDAAAYIAKANEELLKLSTLEPGSPAANDAILQAYKLVAHGFHQFPRDPALTVAYAAMKPIQIFRNFGWRIQGFLIHSPLDYRRYKNFVRRSYEQWRITENRAGMHWIRWFNDTPADAAYDVENSKFANSKEFSLFPNGEKMQEFLATEAFPELDNIAQALEANVVKRSEDFSFAWDLRSGFSNWALQGGGLQPSDESPVKRIGRSEGLVLASMYRTWIGWAKIFCAYNFNSFFKVRSRFNEGKAFNEMAEIVKQFTLPDLFKLWNKNDAKGVLDGKAFIKSSQTDLLASLAIIEELNNTQFAKGDENPGGRWFDYNTLKPWSGRITNLLNEMRALLSGPVALEDSWNKKRFTVNLAGWFDNPPTDLTMFLPTKITSNQNVTRYAPFFERVEVRSQLAKTFGVDLRHLLSPRQNVDLLDLNMHPDWQPTNDPGSWRDFTFNGLFPEAKDRDGVLKGLYTLSNSRSGLASYQTVWGLVFGTLFWTN